MVEVHHEVSFRELAGGSSLPRQKSSTGKQARLGVLRTSFPDIEERLRTAPWKRRDVGHDDILDAYTVLWSALRFSRGEGHYIQLGHGERDSRGVLMRMVV